MIKKFSAVFTMVFLCGCLSPANESLVQQAITKNTDLISQYCNQVVLPTVTNPLVTAASAGTPYAANTILALQAACSPLNIAVVSKSASTLAWLAANTTAVAAGGKTPAPVINPVPIVTGTEQLLAGSIPVMPSSPFKVPPVLVPKG